MRTFCAREGEAVLKSVTAVIAIQWNTQMILHQEYKMYYPKIQLSQLIFK